MRRKRTVIATFTNCSQDAALCFTNFGATGNRQPPYDVLNNVTFLANWFCTGFNPANFATPTPYTFASDVALGTPGPPPYQSRYEEWSAPAFTILHIEQPASEPAVCWYKTLNPAGFTAVAAAIERVCQGLKAQNPSLVVYLYNAVVGSMSASDLAYNWTEILQSCPSLDGLSFDLYAHADMTENPNAANARAAFKAMSERPRMHAWVSCAPVKTPVGSLNVPSIAWLYAQLDTVNFFQPEQITLFGGYNAATGARYTSPAAPFSSFAVVISTLESLSMLQATWRWDGAAYVAP